MNKKELGQRIKDFLDTTDIWVTREELAEKAGVGTTSVYNVFQGKAKLETMQKVAKALGLDILKP